MQLRKVVPILILAACSHVQVLSVTGDSIYEMGQQFLDTKAQFDEALDAGLITKAQYAEFKVFGMKFIQSYPAAAQLYHIAIMADDLAMKDNALQVIIALSADLTKFATQIAGIVKENIPNDGARDAGAGVSL
jgi:acyl transferase domain-containing protein